MIPAAAVRSLCFPSAGISFTQAVIPATSAGSLGSHAVELGIIQTMHPKTSWIPLRGFYTHPGKPKPFHWLLFKARSTVTSYPLRLLSLYVLIPKTSC